MNSLWIETTEKKAYPKLEKNVSCDVCIIGGGITGLTLGYLLFKKGISFKILERNEICSGVTANTTGKLTSQHGLFYNYLVTTFGKDTALKYLHSNEDAIVQIKNIIDNEKIDCDFEWQDSFVYTNDEKELEKIKLEVKTLNELDFPAYFKEDLPLPFKTLGGIGFPKQAQFHARKYCLGLASSFKADSIYEHSKVVDVEKNNNGYKTTCENGCEVSSKFVVVASHYPILNFPGFYFLKMYQDKSYIIAVDTKTDVFKGMYITSNTPVTSFRTAIVNGKRLLLVGGSDHKTGDTSVDIASSYSNLENFVKTLYPEAEILYRWSTEDCITLDKLPYIGCFSKFLPNVYVATGFKKWGMTTSYVAANSIFHEIIGNSLEYSSIYRATRFSPIKNGDEMANMLKQTGYSLFINKLKAPIIPYEELKSR